MSTVIKKFYKIINPESARVAIETSHDLVGDYGMYGNYSWFNKLIQGSESRQQRYREYDQMSNTVDLNRALDIYGQEITGNNPKADLPLKIKLLNGMEQTVTSTTLTTIQAALKTWIAIHEWDLYIFPLVKNVCKYGDAFFVRSTDQRNRWKWVHPKNVVAAITSKDDVTKVKGWIVKTDPTDARDDYNTSSAYMSKNDTYNERIYKSDDVIHFGLHDNLSDDAPFSRSIFTTIYTIFKQKQMIEDAIVIYRLMRAPEKRVFKVEVGNMPAPARARYLEDFKNQIKQRKIPTPNGGNNQIESIYSPIAQNEDFFLTTKDGKGSTIETLPAGNSLGNLDDLEYFYKQMWRGLGIPYSYIDAATESSPISDGKVGIAYMQELQFILKIEQLQLHFEKTFDKEFKRFLRDNNIHVDETVFKVVLPDPSNYKKSRDNEINSAGVNLMNNAISLPFLSTRYAATKYLGWTQAEILENYRMKCEEMGLDYNDRSSMAKVYNPDNADSGGYDGGMTDGSGMSNFGEGGNEGLDDLGGEESIETDNENNTEPTNEPKNSNEEK